MTRFIAASLALLLAACATAPEKDPAYVSPTQYQDYNCKQLSAEMRRVSAKIDQAATADQGKEMLNAAVMAYAIYSGRGYSQGDDYELRRARNQYDVLEQEAIRKECTK